jgi:peptidoglycan-N-acetylglucosamine deacetylase
LRIVIFSKRGLLLSFIIFFLAALGFNYHSQNLTLPSLVKQPGTYYMVNTQEKVVALTFDDGPDPLYTGSILDVLKKKNIKATFFVLGENAKQNPDLLKRINVEGHEIGNHGYSHSYTSSQFVGELARTDEVIYNSIKQHTLFYRPPGGIVSKSVLEGVKDKGHVLTLWSIDSKDWRNPGPAHIVENVVKSTFPGAIILLHDGGEKREQTIQALSSIVDRLKQQGYRFVTVSELRNFESNTPVQRLKPRD